MKPSPGRGGNSEAGRALGLRPCLCALGFTALISVAARASAQQPPAAEPPPPAPVNSAATAEAAPDPVVLSSELSGLSLQELLDVDVTTASKFAQKQSDSPGIISVLSSDDLKRFGGTTLSDVLDRVPGLNVSRGYLTDRSTVAARGDQVRLNSGHILLLINGRPVREAMEGGISSSMFESFPLSAIDRIEVIKGPGSVLYGSDAFSGVINVITKQVTRTGVAASEMIGSNGGNDVSGLATLKAGELRVLLSAQYLKQPNWKDTYLFRNTPVSPVVPLAINGPDKGVGAYLDADYHGLRLMAAYTEWNYWYHLKGIITDGTWNKSFVNLGYQAAVADQWRTELNVGYTNARLDFTKTRPFVQRNSHEVIAEWTNFVDITPEARIVVGGLLNLRGGVETNHAMPTPVTTTNASQQGGEAYAQMDYRPWRELKFIGGVQANKIGSRALAAEPRVGIIAEPSRRVNFKVLYSTAYRAPSIDELFLTDVNLRGNPALRPEKVATFDIGVGYQGDRVQLGLSAFESKQTDIIRPALAPGATGTNGQLVYTNTSGVSLQGVELEAKAYLSRSIYVVGSGLYQRSRDDFGKVNVTPIPALSSKAGVSYMANNGVNVSLFDVYQYQYGSQFENTLNPAPSAHNVLDLHAGLGLNQLFSWRFEPKMQLLLQVNDLLDDRYFIPEWGGTVHDATPGSLGRVVYGGLELAL